MAMSEMKQKLLLYELAQSGFTDAEYLAESDQIKFQAQPGSDRTMSVFDNGDILYAAEHRDIAMNKIRPAVEKVNEIVSAWEASRPRYFVESSRFRVMAEYNDIVMAARDDTGRGRGFHFVTWRYNNDRTGFENGNYTDDYAAAKEDFAKRAGLVPREKLFTQEQALEIKTVIKNLFENDYDLYLSYDNVNTLRSIVEQINDAYPGIRAIADQEQEMESDMEPENAEDYPFNERITADLVKKQVPTAEVFNGEVKVHDWVIVKPDENYGCLVGQVTAIDKLGSDEHDTGNPGDDIHVNFVALECSDQTKAELLEALDGLYPNAASFDDIPLDDVIMPPESLISLTGLGFEEIDKLSASYKAAMEFGNKALNERFNGLEEQLIARVEQNYADYNKSLLGLTPKELIDTAAKIHAHSDAWSYMTSYRVYSDDELAFYTRFENPLSVVADEWHRRNVDLEDLGYTMDFILEEKEAFLDDYALKTKTPARSEPTAEETPDMPKPAQAKPVQPKSEKPKKPSITAGLQEAMEEARAYNEARKQQQPQKSKNKEID